jgi:hypothetical protein
VGLELNNGAMNLMEMMKTLTKMTLATLHHMHVRHITGPEHAFQSMPPEHFFFSRQEKKNCTKFKLNSHTSLGKPPHYFR